MAVMKNLAAAWPSSSAPVYFTCTSGSRDALAIQSFTWAIFWLAATPLMVLAWISAIRWPSRRWIWVTCWPGTRLTK